MTLVRLAFLASIAVAAGGAQAQDWKPYWRIDLGGSIATDAALGDNAANPIIICGNAACTTSGEINDVGTSRMIAFGAGFRVSPEMRFDITYSYRDSYGLKAVDNAANSFNADIVSMSLMLNGYFDIEQSWGTPYLGAGVGYASNKIDQIRVTTVAPSGPLFDLPGGTKSGAAFSLMAGIGWRLSGGTIVDLGYRYLDLGKLETAAGPTRCLGGPTCTAVSYQGMSGELKAHEIAIGLRY